MPLSRDTPIGRETMTEAQRKKFRRGLGLSIVVIALGGVVGVEIGLYNESMQKVQLIQQQSQLLQIDAANMQHEVDMAEVAAFEATHPTSQTTHQHKHHQQN